MTIKKHNAKRAKTNVRRPGIEPGSTAWKAAMLTTIPPTLGSIALLIILLEFCRPVVVCLRMMTNRANMAGFTKFVPQLSVEPRPVRETGARSTMGKRNWEMHEIQNFWLSYDVPSVRPYVRTSM